MPFPQPNATLVAHVRELRRRIHRQPELGFEEMLTSALVVGELERLGISYRRVAQTGIVGVIRGGLPGKTVGLRADMDALPITERSGEPFASEIPGKMHACGHDAHTAMLLGAAEMLQTHRAIVPGNVVLLFQPAEEGPGGAKPMIEQGALDDPHVEAVAMLHVDVRYEAGTLGVAGGPVNASADELRIVVRGKGGHGAYPHTAIDAIPPSAAIITALQNIASRETDPLKSVIVTIGTIAGGYRNNVIADEVVMTGTLRAHDPQIRNELAPRVRRIVEGVASAYNVKAEVIIDHGYPPVINDAQLAAHVRAYLKAETSLSIIEPPPTMGAEDFAYFAERAPGLHMRLGVRNEAAGITASGHSPEFRLDEAALESGVQALVGFVFAVNHNS